jgi:hypothetical protein
MNITQAARELGVAASTRGGSGCLNTEMALISGALRV